MSKAETFVAIHSEPFFEVDFTGVFYSHIRERYKAAVFNRYEADTLPDPEDRIKDVYKHYAKSIGENWEFIARLAKIPGALPTKKILDDMGLIARNCYYLKR